MLAYLGSNGLFARTGEAFLEAMRFARVRAATNPPRLSSLFAFGRLEDSAVAKNFPE
jgi:hypothetical protein